MQQRIDDDFSMDDLLRMDDFSSDRICPFQQALELQPTQPIQSVPNKQSGFNVDLLKRRNPLYRKFRKPTEPFTSVEYMIVE